MPVSKHLDLEDKSGDLFEKYLVLGFLGLLLFTAVPTLAEFSLSERQNVGTPIDLESTISQEAFDDPNHILPVSILVYTEFIDQIAGSYNEFNNTMIAIDENYGKDYFYENLTDYTQLDSSLPGHDILLIPEQEKASIENTTDIGQAWASTLTEYVNDGGIVILMDYGGVLGRGAGSHIYNESGLMQIDSISVITLTSVSLVNSSDALARGVDSSFTAPNGALAFDTPDVTKVVDNGTLPMVVHKTMGRGHVVLLGFDLCIVEGNCSRILANSIRLHRHVVFDESHSPVYSIQGEYSNFIDDLVADGFALSVMGQFSSEYIAGCDVLVLTACGVTYSTQEVAMIEQFVHDGGGLFLVTDLVMHGDALDPVTENFGYMRNKTHYLNDTDDQVTSGTDFQFTLQSDNILNHSATLMVNYIELYGSAGFIQIPDDATSLLFTDTDGTTTFDTSYTEGYQTPANGTPVAASSLSGDGRIVVLGDVNLLAGQNDANSDGTADYYEGQNRIFLQNTMRWLGASGTPERVVVFDESHGAQFTLGISFQGLARHLTSNGYTVKKMTTFYTSLVDTADVLFIVDGTTNHTADEQNYIESFVDNGGSLLLLGARTTARNTVDFIGAKFGMDLNDTGELFDSDDSILSGNYIYYNQSNFAVHPIMDGVRRTEDVYTTAFNDIGSGTSLITTDSDGTCTWSGGGAADGLTTLVALEHGHGRVVFSSGYVFLSSSQNGDADDQVNFYDSDNDLLTTNIFKWLSDDRGADLEVLTPNGGEVVTGDDIVITWDAVDPNDDPITFNLFYSANGGTGWTPLVSGLTVDHYTWDITGVSDSIEYLIRIEAVSTIFTVTDESDAQFTIDRNPPQWDPAPTDVTINEGERISIQINASDISGIDSWWVNDTTHFSINESGYLEDNAALTVGVYGLEISVNDTLGHIQTIALSITVLEVTTTDTTTTGTDTTTTDADTDTNTDTDTVTPPPFDTNLIIIIVGAVIAVIVIIVVIMMRKKGS